MVASCALESEGIFRPPTAVSFAAGAVGTAGAARVAGCEAGGCGSATAFRTPTSITTWVTSVTNALSASVSVYSGFGGRRQRQHLSIVAPARIMVAE
eukprot:2003072-Prymnesium_polylepis.1